MSHICYLSFCRIFRLCGRVTNCSGAAVAAFGEGTAKKSQDEGPKPANAAANRNYRERAGPGWGVRHILQTRFCHTYWHTIDLTHIRWQVSLLFTLNTDYIVLRLVITKTQGLCWKTHSDVLDHVENMVAVASNYVSITRPAKHGVSFSWLSSVCSHGVLAAQADGNRVRQCHLSAKTLYNPDLYLDHVVCKQMIFQYLW